MAGINTKKGYHYLIQVIIGGSLRAHAAQLRPGKDTYIFANLDLQASMIMGKVQRLIILPDEPNNLYACCTFAEPLVGDCNNYTFTRFGYNNQIELQKNITNFFEIYAFGNPDFTPSQDV